MARQTAPHGDFSVESFSNQRPRSTKGGLRAHAAGTIRSLGDVMLPRASYRDIKGHGDSNRYEAFARWLDLQ